MDNETALKTMKQNFSECQSLLIALGDDTLKAIKILKRGGKIGTISGIPEARFAKENNSSNLRALLFKFTSKKLTSASKRKDVDYRFMLMKSDGSNCPN